ncbi:hypothetical protein H310_01938 [Aphanomyces invadans]|uniref:Uncharacterized protein n=1 Tax=Aphanomyces invadans TaxID=157072 RepID=A0A024UMP9_9STRA|nr:hypothetical protein H310_01938 [Aphanomyces invadans]ETW07415.1 hypothetical protein H310_01938 [Aphanomyces invadans]|eukprot:XP_008863508.1 hypothetical protein H310_01938 [Aphanomyces invadans]
MLREMTKVAIGKVESPNVDKPAGDAARIRSNCPPGDHVRCIEVTFKAPPIYFSHLSFQNYYAAMLRIDQVVQGRCVTILDRFRLMQNAHHEDDAQNWHIIKREEFGAPLDVAKAEHFIFYLLQPSPLWEKWELRSIKLFESTDAPEIIPKTLLSLDKPTAENSSIHLYRKYTVNTSGVALDSKDISGHATRFIDLLALLQAKLAKDVK